MIHFLIGMPGAGKSTVGRELARTLNYAFIDTDDWIENRACLSIPEIFDEVGEDGFREMEQECLEALLGKENLIVATGGGMAANQQRLELMQELGQCIYLELDIDNLLIRLKQESGRPLLEDEQLENKLRELLSHRESYYKQAEIKVSAQGQTSEIVQRILGYLK